MNWKQKFSLAGALIGGVASIISALSVVGRTARSVDVITLFAGGVVFGASLVTLRTGRRKPKA